MTQCGHPDCEQYGHSNCKYQGTEDQRSGLADGADQRSGLADGADPHAVSDPDEKLMAQVQKVSAPSLAQLYKMGRARGLIQAQRGYQ